MKITKEHRQRLNYYLKQFYKQHPDEKFTIFHFVKYFKTRLKNNKDAWMGVSGETGTGKSLFVIINQILFGRPYDLTKNIAYIPKGDEISKMFDKINFNTLLIDEAAREMRSVNWQSKAQQGVNMKAMTDRFKNNWIFLNMPNFNEFTKSMRTGNIKFRAVIPYRTKTYARVIIQMKSRNWRSDDPWSDEKANDVYKKVERKYKEIDNDMILKIERNLPNTIMDFIVPNLELILPDVTAEYERLKMESRKVAEEEEPENKMNKYKKQYDDLRIKFAKFLNENPIGLGLRPVTKGEQATFLGCSNSTFNKLLSFKIEEPKKKKNFRELEKVKPKAEAKVMYDFDPKEVEVAIKQNQFKTEFKKLKE